MEYFVKIVFGGLFAVLLGIFLAYGTGRVWSELLPEASVQRIRDIKAAASEAVYHSSDGTSISGMKRLVRYTANDEEDILDAAGILLPSNRSNEITAKAYIVKNLSENTVITSFEEDRLMPVASLTKLVSAVVAKNNIDDEEKVTITSEIVSTYGNTAQFRTGETLNASHLYYPLLMVSSNDAAEALARKHGRADFIARMNDFAQSIGAYRTYFADPSGLSPANVSTANDMVIILDWIRKNRPDILEITALKTKNVRAHTWVNPTHFLSWSNYIGGKNGYTDEADRTSASLFKIGPDNKVYAVIVLGSTSRDSDVYSLLSKLRK